MTDRTIAELIAEARQLIRHSSVSVPEHANMLGRLATALEAADQRADQAEATAEHLHDEDSREIVALTQERDQLAAVVEKVRAADSASSSWDHFGHLVMDILATAPADALRELKANVWDECVDDAEGRGWVHRYAVSDMHARNPYRPREEQS